MGVFIVVVAAGIGGLVGGFNQAKANPNADNFFDSKATRIVQHGSSID
jgi:hypothetical protein